MMVQTSGGSGEDDGREQADRIAREAIREMAQRTDGDGPGPAVLYMSDGIESGGYVIILLDRQERDARKLVVELPTSLVRAVLALGQAMDEDAGILRVARGWRRPERIVKMIADQDERLPFIEPQTVRSYVSRIKKRIRQAAKAQGLADVPELFEHRRQKGVRLTSQLLVVDGSGNGSVRKQG